MAITFTSKDKKVNGFLKMGKLLGFLETSNNKADKILAIRMALADGFITEDEALELETEF